MEVGVKDEVFDCYIQAPHQSIAFRLHQYHKNIDTRSVLYPNGGCEDTVHLDRHPDVDQLDSLLLMRRLTVPPSKLKDWFENTFLRSAITRMYFFPQSSQVSDSFEDLVQKIIAEGPHPAGTIRLLCYPRSIESILADRLPESFELHPVKYQIVLHMVKLNDSNYRYSYRHPNELFLTLPNGPKRTPMQLCKAAGKLAEVFNVTKYKPGNSAAIDIGAAPGGWTAQLATKMKLVLAIDPAELHPFFSLDNTPNVVHIKKKSQDALEDIKAALGDTPVDMLVCDANQHPKQIIRMLEPLLDLLQAGGYLVVTMKLRGRGSDRSDLVEPMTASLGPRFENVRFYWLLANTISERTLIAQRCT